MKCNNAGIVRAKKEPEGCTRVPAEGQTHHRWCDRALENCRQDARVCLTRPSESRADSRKLIARILGADKYIGAAVRA